MLLSMLLNDVLFYLVGLFQGIDLNFSTREQYANTSVTLQNLLQQRHV
jgi:hypothetical protein